MNAGTRRQDIAVSRRLLYSILASTEYTLLRSAFRRRNASDLDPRLLYIQAQLNIYSVMLSQHIQL